MNAIFLRSPKTVFYCIAFFFANFQQNIRVYVRTPLIFISTRHLNFNTHLYVSHAHHFWLNILTSKIVFPPFNFTTFECEIENKSACSQLVSMLFTFYHFQNLNGLLFFVYLYGYDVDDCKRCNFVWYILAGINVRFNN